MKKLRKISEDEVVAQFLRYEFYQEEFHQDREQFEPMVLHPDLSNPEEAAIRRALLLRRRRNVWLELPSDTQWFEMEMEPEDLPRMRVFTRGFWAEMTGDNHHLLDFVERVRSHRLSPLAYRHLTKVQSVRYRLRESGEVSTVLLLSSNEHSPITIMEGNNRLTAVLLDSFDLWRSRFRFFVGLSPQMDRCVFYDCNRGNFVRYAFRAIKRKILGTGRGLPIHEKGRAVLPRNKAAWLMHTPGGTAKERKVTGAGQG